MPGGGLEKSGGGMPGGGLEKSGSGTPGGGLEKSGAGIPGGGRIAAPPMKGARPFGMSEGGGSLYAN